MSQNWVTCGNKNIKKNNFILKLNCVLIDNNFEKCGVFLSYFYFNLYTVALTVHVRCPRSNEEYIAQLRYLRATWTLHLKNAPKATHASTTRYAKLFQGRILSCIHATPPQLIGQKWWPQKCHLSLKLCLFWIGSFRGNTWMHKRLLLLHTYDFYLNLHFTFPCRPIRS